MPYTSEGIGEFLDQVASTRVSPAGGTCTAVVGATGASLAEMACIHTLEGQNPHDSPDELHAIRDDLSATRAQLLQLAESDAAVVANLFAGDGDDRRLSKRATGIPLTMASACLDVLESGTVLLRACNENVRPDAYSGTVFAHGALRAAIYTVRTNVTYVEDPAFCRTVERRADEIESAAGDAMAAIHDLTGA